ncbi:hypothetical protein NDI54_05800 [Haloarcula sp. S1AR25-5A]|uniref:Uncharacterized protein n=1 Tax=Haloarcula terrestris TaxID=2950533 RepID=A0AAE4JG26_9EURY|nr:hypothetical protein [Haloarcula terrestris]MDS0220867.1 hypothetical protein [Haloarcula terrestris]
MSAQKSKSDAEQPEQSADQPTDRPDLPLERVIPDPSDGKPAWRRASPDLSAGYEEISLACECGHPDDTFEDVTSS